MIVIKTVCGSGEFMHRGFGKADICYTQIPARLSRYAIQVIDILRATGGLGKFNRAGESPDHGAFSLYAWTMDCLPQDTLGLEGKTGALLI